MPPLLLLFVLCAVTVVAAGASAWRRKARSGRLAGLAAGWRMSFTAQDRFDLAARIGPRFPIPGAADIVVRDLIYKPEGSGFRYLFTVEYTVGVTRTKRRKAGAGMVVERCQTPKDFSEVTLAPAEIGLAEQYEWLWKGLEGTDRGRLAES